MGIEFKEIKFKDVDLFTPYQMEGADAPGEESDSYFMFLSREDEPRVLEHNQLIDSVSIHRWRKFSDKNKDPKTRSYSIRKFKNYPYVIRSLFEAESFFEQDN